MRKYISIIILFLFVAVGAQGKKNPFMEGEQVERAVDARATADGSNGGNPPGEGDPLPTPIDDYIPLLVIAAMGLIVYHTYRKKQVS